jgi:hypothetical protein
VLLTNDDAVLNDRSHGPDAKPCGLNGCTPWVRRIAYRTGQLARLKIRTERA